MTSGAAATFEEHREALYGVAYRMLGSVMEAEDVVQDAFLRWEGADRAEVRNPEAFLTTVVSRLALDRLRAARSTREVYPGPWLPEPLVEGSAVERVEHEESLTTAFLVLLESLAPEARVAWVLRVAFDYDYATIARVVGASEAACRQMVHRARGYIRERRPRFEGEPERARRAVERFRKAVLEGDMEALVDVLAGDAVMWSDGGGVVPSARRPVKGAERVARFFLGVTDGATAEFTTELRVAGSSPVLIVRSGGHPLSVLTFQLSGEGIRRIFMVTNPRKLEHLEPSDRA